MQKAKSMIGSADIAKLGYRKLPGSAIPEMGSAIRASGPRAKPGAALAADNSTALSTSAAKPSKSVPADVSLSTKHHRESIRFNMSHAAEHAKEATKHKKALVKMSRRGG